MTNEGMGCVHGRLVMELVMTTQCRFPCVFERMGSDEASQRARTTRGEDAGERMAECTVASARLICTS